MSQQAQRWCPDCERNVLATRAGVNHTFHLLMCVFTCWLWMLVWFLLSLTNLGGWLCPRCGSRCAGRFEVSCVGAVLIGAALALLIAVGGLFGMAAYAGRASRATVKAQAQAEADLPAPAPAPAPIPVKPPPTPKEEADAAAFLREAKEFTKIGNRKLAGDDLRKVLADYPDTKAAVEARELLAALGQ